MTLIKTMIENKHDRFQLLKDILTYFF